LYVSYVYEAVNLSYTSLSDELR